MKLCAKRCNWVMFLALAVRVLLLRTISARISKIFPCPPACMCDIVTQRVDCSALGLAKLPPSLPLSTRILLFRENHLEDELTNKTFNITYLVRLRQLSLANNSLIEIEESVFENQERLMKLDLTSNHLQSFPEAIQNMRLLKHLYLSKNHINYISDNHLPANSIIEHLYLDYNEISDIHERAFASQKHLQVLYLEANLISNISRGLFSRLPALIQLDLSYNRLGADLNTQYELLGDDIPTPKTAELSPSPGPVVNFSDWVAPHGASSLESLNVKGNIMKTITHDAFSLFPILTSLNFGDNHLVKLPAHVLDNLTHLERLDLSGNNLTMLPDKLFKNNRNLHDLDLSRNLIYGLPMNIFSGLEESLFKLDLSANYLESISFLEAHFRRRVELDLSKNGITDVTSTGFTHMVSIEVLLLQENRLTTIPNTRSLTRLRELNLANNLISSIPNDAFDGNVALETIDLQNNAIATILIDPFPGLPSLSWVLVEGNPINCDCNVRWLDSFKGDDYYYYSSHDTEAAEELGISKSDFYAMETWILPLKQSVACVKPNIVYGEVISTALYGYQSDLICNHYANPRSVMILILTWFLIIIVFLILFWGRTFWMARKQLGTSRPRKTKEKPKEEDTCYVISSVSKKAGNGQYHLLPDKTENEPLVFTSNHADDVKMRTFDRSTEIFIETTV